MGCVGNVTGHVGVCDQEEKVIDWTLGCVGVGDQEEGVFERVDLLVLPLEGHAVHVPQLRLHQEEKRVLVFRLYGSGFRV